MKTTMKNSFACASRWLLMGAALSAITACGKDETKTKEPVVFILEDEPDMGEASEEMTPEVDMPAAQPDMTPDMAPEEMDMPAPDMAPDMAVTYERAPRARIFLNDPTTDGGQLTEVELPLPTSLDGSLFNDSVEVVNCINELGEPLSFMGFTVGNLCQEIPTVAPQDGDFLHVVPPADFNDPQDSFAEVQMYYHVNTVHDYFAQELGVGTLPQQLSAIPNVQFYVNRQAAGFLGVQPGWQAFDNAAFLFPESFEQVGLPRREEGAIVFGQGSRVDFSYDASVIHHEYTHSLIGNMRLSGVLVDGWGLNNTPGAINEALADYFAASMQENTVVGRYGLAAFGAAFARDLGQKHTCPADLSTEVHDDGRIIGSMLWAVREALGKERADALIMRATLSSTQLTEFKGFGEALVDEASMISAEVEQTVQGIVDEWGLRDCNRSKPWVAWRATSVPYSFPGKQELGGAQGLGDFVPGYLQFEVDVPEGKAVELSWTMAPSQFGGSSRLEALTRKGAPIQLSTSLNGTVTTQYDVRHAPALSGTTQKLVLDPGCLAQGGEKTHVMLVNAQNNGANVQQMGIRVLDAPAAGAATCEP